MKLTSPLISSTWLLTAIVTLPWMTNSGVEGHGYIYDPPARNFVAKTTGLTFGSQTGVPSKEYCPQCLNQNAGVCGITQDGTTDYDLWLDSTGTPMPFVSQRTYGAGQTIEVNALLTANHAGHAEMRGCSIDESDADQGCLDSYLFEFIADDSYDMPKDPVYPERGYFYGGQGANGLDFRMRFRIPDNLVGSKVLLQWQYITANSCNPPGYGEYFRGRNSKNEALPDSFWSPLVADCEFPYPADGSTSAVAPERFWNCAEVTILGDGVPPPPPTDTEVPASPTRAPTAPTNAPVSAPTLAPVAPQPTPRPTNLRTPAPQPVPTSNPGATQCGKEWDSCFDNQNSCCEDNYCEVFQWYARCRREPDACLLEWNPCNDDPTACCDGLVCTGDGFWNTCQVP